MEEDTQVVNKHVPSILTLLTSPEMEIKLTCLSQQ